MSLIQNPKTPATSPLLRVEAVSKRFGNIVALQEVSFDVERNEVAAIVGQNGAGKSTLTKILVGAERADHGRLFYNGAVFEPRNPGEAARLGISIVYQETATVPDLKVFQWMYLGREIGKGLRLRIGEMKRRTDAILRELDVGCTPDDRIRDLSVVTKKMIEIAKAIQIVRGGERAQGDENAAGIIIMDEPTAPLTENEKKILYAKIHEIKGKSSFLFISHIIPEVLDVADRIYVLRDGRNAGAYALEGQKVTEQMIYEAMLGREIVSLDAGDKSSSREVALRVNNISSRTSFYDVSFELRRGEILALHGLPSSGKSEIAKAIAGIIRQDSGTIEKNGRPLRPSIRERIKDGIGYFSGQRSEELFLIWPVVTNISAASLDRLRRMLLKLLPILDTSKEKAMAMEIVSRMNIRPPSINMLTSNLSGGNMQKVGLGKWFARDLEILILENPTIGIDAGTKEEFYAMLLGMRMKGKAFILISDDLDEIRRLCHRVLLVEQGRISQTLSRRDISQIGL